MVGSQMRGWSLGFVEPGLAKIPAPQVWENPKAASPQGSMHSWTTGVLVVTSIKNV